MSKKIQCPAALGFRKGTKCETLGAMLTNPNGVTMREIMDKVGAASNWHYNVMRSLQKKGLVKRIKGRPARFTVSAKVAASKQKAA